MNLLKPSEKALALSKKISIRMNKWGVLSIQYLVQAEADQSIFIEFLCLPDEENGTVDDEM
jgi:cell cycle checkpoint protein